MFAIISMTVVILVVAGIFFIRLWGNTIPVVAIAVSAIVALAVVWQFSSSGSGQKETASTVTTPVRTTPQKVNPPPKPKPKPKPAKPIGATPAKCKPKAAHANLRGPRKVGPDRNDHAKYVVAGKRIEKVTFYLKGKKRKFVRKAPFSYATQAESFRTEDGHKKYGLHTVSAKVKYKKCSTRSRQTLTMQVRRLKPPTRRRVVKASPARSAPAPVRVIPRRPARPAPVQTPRPRRQSPAGGSNQSTGGTPIKRRPPTGGTAPKGYNLGTGGTPTKRRPPTGGTAPKGYNLNPG